MQPIIGFIERDIFKLFDVLYAKSSLCLRASVQPCFVFSLRCRLQESILSVDLSFSQTLRMVHRCVARRGEKGRDKCSGNSHFHHSVLP